MDRQEILDVLEGIQERNNNTFLGSNEAELHTREDIADRFLQYINDCEKAENNYNARLQKQIIQLCEYSYRKGVLAGVAGHEQGVSVSCCYDKPPYREHFEASCGVSFKLSERTVFEAEKCNLPLLVVFLSRKHK